MEQAFISERDPGDEDDGGRSRGYAVRVMGDVPLRVDMREHWSRREERRRIEAGVFDELRSRR